MKGRMLASVVAGVLVLVMCGVSWAELTVRAEVENPVLDPAEPSIITCIVDNDADLPNTINVGITSFNRQVYGEILNNGEDFFVEEEFKNISYDEKNRIYSYDLTKKSITNSVGDEAETKTELQQNIRRISTLYYEEGKNENKVKEYKEEILDEAGEVLVKIDRFDIDYDEQGRIINYNEKGETGAGKNKYTKAWYLGEYMYNKYNNKEEIKAAEVLGVKDYKVGIFTVDVFPYGPQAGVAIASYGLNDVVIGRLLHPKKPESVVIGKIDNVYLERDAGAVMAANQQLQPAQPVIQQNSNGTYTNAAVEEVNGVVNEPEVLTGAAASVGAVAIPVPAATEYIANSEALSSAVSEEPITIQDNQDNNNGTVSTGTTTTTTGVVFTNLNRHSDDKNDNDEDKEEEQAPKGFYSFLKQK